MDQAMSPEDMQRLMELSQTIGNQQALAGQLRGQQAGYMSAAGNPQMRQAGGTVVAPGLLETLSSAAGKVLASKAGGDAYGAEGAARGAQDQQNQMLMASLLRQQSATQAATQPTQPTMPRMPAPNAAFQTPPQQPAQLGSGMYGIQ